MNSTHIVNFVVTIIFKGASSSLQVMIIDIELGTKRSYMFEFVGIICLGREERKREQDG